MDYTVYQLLWLFLFYSFLGWLAETVLAALKRRRLLNRGFLSAPFSPTYGLGALLFAIFLPELRGRPIFPLPFGHDPRHISGVCYRCIPGAHLSSEMVGLFRPAVSV